ncbi:MAG TPA: DnaA N-terminal domain-containing protein [Anaerolineae bacterium]|nr:DnaA N-terminal domain-containing protein [Anaerolineae bacterium]
MRTMKETLHLLKGARLHVLHALKYAQDSGLGAVGWQWLSEQTGYSKGGVTAALQALVTASPPLVERVRHYEGWSLHKNAYQLPIFVSPVKPEPTSAPASPSLPPLPVEAEPTASITTTLVALSNRLSAIEVHLSAVSGQLLPPQSAHQPNYPPQATFCPSPSNDDQASPAHEDHKVTATASNRPTSATFCPSSTTPTPHDHDTEMIINHNELDHESDHDLTERITALSTADDELINRLTAIGFDHARQRLASLPRYELAAWLLWWEWLPSDRQQWIKRPAGFIRSRLQKKLWPDDLVELWSATASQPAPSCPPSQPAEPQVPSSALEPAPEPASPPEPQEARIWRHTLDELSLQMTQTTFNSWLADSKLVQAAEGVYVILVRNEYACDWLTNRLKPMILRTLRVIAEAQVDVAFVTESTISAGSRQVLVKEVMMA